MQTALDDKHRVLLREYAQRVRNLRDPDPTGTDEDLVLSTRTSMAKLVWTPEQQAEIDRLDEKLATFWNIFEGTLPHHQEHPREQWWWFLHEGPQVLEEARRVKA